VDEEIQRALLLSFAEEEKNPTLSERLPENPSQALIKLSEIEAQETKEQALEERIQYHQRILQDLEKQLEKKRKCSNEIGLWNEFLLRWKEWSIEDFFHYLIRVDNCKYSKYLEQNKEQRVENLEKFKNVWNQLRQAEDTSQGIERSVVFTGECLRSMDREDLQDFGISDKKDRRDLWGEIQRLIKADMEGL